MELTLVRKYHSEGTNGVLLYKHNLICYTIELPWKNNVRRVSCIPEGRYQLAARHSRRFGSHYILKDVPGRSYVLIHPANDARKELQGCIAPVTRTTDDGKGIGSRQALNKLKILINPNLADASAVFLTIKSYTSEKNIAKSTEAYPEIF